MATAKKTTPTPAPPARVYKRVRLLSPLRLDGDDVAEGEVLDLVESQATSLLATGAAELVVLEGAEVPQDWAVLEPPKAST